VSFTTSIQPSVVPDEELKDEDDEMVLLDELDVGQVNAVTAVL
jgi:hypothetical protein